MNPLDSQALVAPSDIAEIAGVSRGAVSNWRKRSEDFPDPVAGSPMKPLFNRAEVEEWLVASGKEVRADYGLYVWTAVNALRDIVDMADIPALVLSIACARKLCAETGNDHLWDEMVENAKKNGLAVLSGGSQRYGITDWDALVPLSDGMRNLSPAIAPALLVGFTEVPVEDLSSVTDFALSRVAVAYGKGGAEHGFVGSQVSELLINVSADDAKGIVYDPACGIGEVLLGLATKASGRVDRWVGHDWSDRATELLKQRAYLAGEQIDIAHYDVLQHDVEVDLKADLVVCEPPFGASWDPQIADPRWSFGVPPRSSSDLAWIQHVVAHLTHEGVGYVVTSHGALSRSAEVHIRTKLLAAGCIEAIIGLPPKMLPHTSIPLALWVLRSPGTTTGSVRIIDASRAESPETQASDWLRCLDPFSSPVPTVDVPVTDLLAEEGALSPARWTAPQADSAQIAERYQEALTNLNNSLDVLATVSRPLHAFTTGRGARVVTVGDLVKQGAIEMKQGRPTKEKDSADVVVTAGDVRDQTLPKHAAVNSPDPLTTRPGDVLVTTMNVIRTLVDPTGGHRLGNGVYRLSLLNDQLSSEYVAAVLPGEWNTRHQSGSTIQRANLRDLEIPVLPRGLQDAVTAALAEIANLRDRAVELETQAAELSRQLMNAVRFDAPLVDQKQA